MRARHILHGLAATSATAALLYFGTGLHPIWWMAWLAPIPLLAVAPELRRGADFFLASAAWFIGGLNQWTYFTRALELPMGLILMSLAIPAVIFGFGILLARTFLRHGSILLSALAFPVYWVACEYLVAISSPHSTFGNLGYSQMDCLPLIQIASITGIWGISFIMFLFAGTVATLLHGHGTPARRRALAIGTGVVICAVFLFGEWRLRPNQATHSVKVTLMAKDVPMSLYLGPEDKLVELLHDYAGEVRRVTPAGTQLVVLPEKIARLNEGDLAEVDALFSSAAAATHAAIDLGLVRRKDADAFNSSRYYSPDGKLVATYDKHHLLPGVEPEKPGDKRVVLDQFSARLGLEICKDMDFPQLSREYAHEGANLLLVPAWDFGLDRWLHARMAVLRGVENGFAVARAARNGLLTLSDNRGRILAEAASVPDRFTSLSGNLNVANEKTFYSRTGDWFGWLCLILLGVLVISHFHFRHQRIGYRVLATRE